MLLLAPFEQAVRTLRANATRSTLTVLGIVIGIASVIVLVSAGRGAQSLILDQIQGVGSNLIFIIPGGTKEGRVSAPVSVQGVVITTLTRDDARAFLRPKLAPSVLDAAASVRGQVKLQHEAYEETLLFQGVDASFFRIREMDVANGSALTEEQVAGLGNVAVIGTTLADDVFGEQDPVGQTVRLNRRAFRVVGVLEEKGLGPFGIDQDRIVLIPISTAQKLLLGISYVHEIDVQATRAEDVDSARAEVVSVLRDRHDIQEGEDDDFTVRTMKDSLEALGIVTTALTLFLSAIAGISLLVGGIGIMNIMLVAVTERTREIGLRKAVGARRRDILVQFLVEALVLTLAGGAFGIVLGLLGAYGVSKAGTWDFVASPDIVVLATSVAALFGIAFGLYPAVKASRLNPIDALRFE